MKITEIKSLSISAIKVVRFARFVGFSWVFHRAVSEERFFSAAGIHEGRGILPIQ